MPLRGRITLLAAVLQLVILTGADYDLQFNLESYASIEGVCNADTCVNGCPVFCNYIFFLCERPAGTPISYDINSTQGNCLGFEHNTADSAQQNRDVGFSITFSGPEWPTEGVQIFIEIRDPTIFKDRIVINVTNTTVGGSPSNQIYVGIFNNVEINATIKLVCTQEFQGPTCEIFCGRNCSTCLPGFTGSFCATDIDFCSGVTCGPNQRCVDGILNHTCVCEPGYTGPDCLINIDDCIGIDCNGGLCIDGVNSFTCDCRDGFTGPLCTEIDYCARATCGQNQRCVNGILNFTCMCADGENCSVCAGSPCHNNGQCIDGGGGGFFTCNCFPRFTGELCEMSTGDDSVNLVVAVTAAALLLVLAISLSALIGCLLYGIKKIKQLRSVANTTESAVPGSLNIAPANSNLPNQPTTASTPNEYDYPLSCPENKESYHFQRCPAYSVTSSNQSYDPAYAVVDTISNGEADDHIYY